MLTPSASPARLASCSAVSSSSRSSSSRSEYLVGHDPAAGLGYPRLPGAETAIPDDHAWMRLAECPQPGNLVRLLVDEPQRTVTAHRSSLAMTVMPVVIFAACESKLNSTDWSTGP